MPKYYHCEPRSEEWRKLRVGVATSSEFSRIITAKGDLSQAKTPHGGPVGYMYELICEQMLGRELDDDAYESPWMVRGQENEDAAVSCYEFQSDIETDVGGFVTNDAGTYGCSPDRLIAKDGGLELKIPRAKSHLAYLIDPNSLELEYRQQVQGSLLITEREYWDIMSWHPEMPHVIKRCRRNEEYIGKLRTALDAFCEQMIALRTRLEQTYGPFRPLTQDAPPDDDLDGLGFDVTPDDVAQMVDKGFSVPWDKAKDVAQMISGVKEGK